MFSPLKQQRAARYYLIHYGTPASASNNPLTIESYNRLPTKYEGEGALVATQQLVDKFTFVYSVPCHFIQASKTQVNYFAQIF